MAPTRSKKRKSTESTSSEDIQNFPAPPQTIPTKTHSPARTPPNRSPIRKQKVGITLAQKQALIDNLQLEITERARKLRAQYNLQAQGLKTRIEIRVNRIPMALRRAKMGDLQMKYSESVKPAATTSKISSPQKNMLPAGQNISHISPSPKRAPKRLRYTHLPTNITTGAVLKTLSDDISTDKENADIENPKKRVRGAIIPPARTTTSKIAPSTILSPRSANSRTLPHSPIRPALSKSFLARPVSPLKQTAPMHSGAATSLLTSMVEKAKGTRAAATRKVTAEKPAPATAGRGRRVAPPAAAPVRAGRGRASTISESSEGSNATIVKKQAPAVVKPAVKKSVMGTLKGMGSKKMAGGTKASTAPAATAGGRVLRKRN
ncbi:hypothetical protein MBM_00075 [Drepanopeziza brunnea f. sp. 'multigermtubi' MB_m1]|uniref:Borealin N-terminal domain-containing protein n=1 Tax=Marssonina brunnea f. sp. multigermtubi (strain MB_m1) TaxID=1072389 RepID=K1X779_MARBU|nr:uncharacterized protein MBM_00075 [Drepanopeziza brunnea f. sp. 'multigermtubi' MB_m1]EKD20962.1 hypothetical protein MBM_00075 [Drepanopeziza brunnea f. sp. 'multigermtubi' MB_m1]